MGNYNRMDPSALQETEAHQLFQNVADHYQGCEGFFGAPADINVPTEVRLVCRLWFFLAEIGGGGINDYLWNHCFNLAALQQVQADLREIGALELLDLLEAGICISLESSCGEFLEDEGARVWASQFRNKLNLSPEQLDALSLAAAYPGGSEIIARFIRVNRTLF